MIYNCLNFFKIATKIQILNQILMYTFNSSYTESKNINN